MKLTRPREGAMIGGVCAGLANYFKIDVTLVRVIFAIVTIFAGSGLLVYVVLWVVMPREDDGGSLAEEGFGKAKQWYDDRKANPTDPQDPETPRYDI